jgi:DNA-binding PadR family transcriptional regulator
VQFLILGLLLHGPLSGYGLRKQFTAGISLFYSASLGGIQRSLALLDARGWVARQASADSGRSRYLYSITDSGREAWRDWMLSPITESNAEQTALAKVYLLDSLPTEDRGDCIDLLCRRAASDLNRLARLRAEIDVAHAPKQLEEAARFRLATLDYGIRAHELMVRWLGELEAA